MSEFRQIRRQLEITQRACAMLLNRAEESCRVWDSGRRLVPMRVIAELRNLARMKSRVPDRESWIGSRRAKPASHSPQRQPPPPSDYSGRIVALRRALKVSQLDLAKLIGAANRAVVYQWESRKRQPSPKFWSRLEPRMSSSDNIRP
jgi:DNA-binding transcriptional regulator YiaG